MARRFRGRHVNKVDSKGRVSIPAKFRRAVEEGDPDWAPGESPTVVFTIGISDEKCIEAFTIEGMDEIDDDLAEMQLLSEERTYWEEILNGDSEELGIDGSGRVVIPAWMREEIGITDSAVVVGMGSRFRVWAPEAYEAKREKTHEWVRENGTKLNPLGARQRRRRHRDNDRGDDDE